MNSSGIKRGLASSAIAALAITGLPFLASSASAAVGDSIAVASTGPVLNGGDQGGVVVLKTKGVDPANLKLKGADLVSSPNNASQTVSIVGTPTRVANGAAGDSNKTDGLDEITMHVAVTTANAGDTAKFAVYEDEPTQNDSVDAAEARAQVSMTTSGPVSQLDVAPASQSAVQGFDSGDYTVTLKDAAGRTTQLLTSDSIDVKPADTDTTVSDASLDSTETELGSGTFTAKSGVVGAHVINVADHTTPTVKNKATLNVTKAAGITADEVDIVTGADDWDGFGDGTDGGTTEVRVDQSSIRIDFKSVDPANDKNSTVTLDLTGSGITFGGKSTATVSTVLDNNGVGSITITPDAGTVQVGDQIVIGGSFAQTLDFERAQPSEIKPTADPYFSKVGGSVDVTATVLDQFGQPVTTGFVEASRSGVNNDTAATTQRKPVGSDGSVTFTFTDTKATDGQSDTVNFKYFPDQYATASTVTGNTHIKYTTDGMGSDFKTSLEDEGVNHDTEAPTYKASDVSIMPLADAYADDYNSTWDDASDLTVANAEPGSDITVSVDNGALILAPGEDKLSQGSSSITDVVTPAGNLLPGYRIIGTKSGVVTVTTEAAHRTETAQMTIAPESDTSTARNVAVSGPASVDNGTTQITYTAVVTDAFGNPVPGIYASDLNVQVSGPAQYQDGDVMTDQNGQLNLTVKVDPNAVGDVTIKVTGLPGNWNQFGAAADRLDSKSTSDNAKGLPASANVGTATTTVMATPPPPRAPRLNGRDNGANDDHLKVNAPATSAGKTIKLYTIKNGVKKVVAKAVADSKGDARFTVADKNGKARTKYIAKVAKVWTNKKSVR